MSTTFGGADSGYDMSLDLARSSWQRAGVGAQRG
jgi:hypothetical protein